MTEQAVFRGEICVTAACALAACRGRWSDAAVLSALLEAVQDVIRAVFVQQVRWSTIVECVVEVRRAKPPTWYDRCKRFLRGQDDYTVGQSLVIEHILQDIHYSLYGPLSLRPFVLLGYLENAQQHFRPVFNHRRVCVMLLLANKDRQTLVYPLPHEIMRHILKMVLYGGPTLPH